MNKYNKFFTSPTSRDLVVRRVSNNSEDTFYDICTRYIPNAISQNQKIAKEIFKIASQNGKTKPTKIGIAQTIYNFCRTYITYKLDKMGFEEIRLPSKLWADKLGDCEDFTIFCSSILINLGIAHHIRMADYGDGWQHIYLKIDKLTLDPVDPIFNHEDKGKYLDYLISPNIMLRSKLWESKKTKGLGRIGIDAQKARSDGKFVENGIEYERQRAKTISNYMVRGRDCKISFTLDVTVDGYYALIPAKLLQPSHIGSLENPYHFLPDAQPRNRAMSTSGANVPELMANNLRPAEVCEGSTAYSGTPIINERGEVIQGNGRASALKTYWQKNPLDTKGYIDYLVEYPAQYGFDKFPSKIYSQKKTGLEFDQSFMYLMSSGSLTGVPNPVLVRIVPSTDGESIILGQYKQTDLEAIATKTNDTKSKVALITPKILADILRTVFGDENTEDTLSELIRKSNVSSLLVRNKIFRSDDFTENYLNQRTGELNADGVRVISDLIVGLIFKGADTNTPELFRQLPDRVQTAIAKSAKYILGNNPKNDLSGVVSTAIVGTINYLQFKDLGNDYKSWSSQTSIFGKSPVEQYTKQELALIKLFGDAKTQQEIVNHFKKIYTLTTDEVRTGIDFFNEPLRKAKTQEVAFTEVFEQKKAMSIDREIGFVNHLVVDFSKKVKHNKLSLEKLALQFGIEKSIHIKELTELAIVMSARSLANSEFRTKRERFDAIVELYQLQPNSSLRTSESILFQQYSTPSPIAVLMGWYCGLDKPFVGNGKGIKGSQFYEPSAGNGVLTIAANDELLFDVNELSPYRLSLLKKQGFANATQLDASVRNVELSKKYRAVITNPPFGALDDKTKFDGYPIGNLDHIMTILALEAMQDDGKAAIIIGGNTNWDKEGRIQAGKNRIFINFLYAHYHVDEIINLDGKSLYSRQGTGFNVRIILINGRKEKTEGYAPLYNEHFDKQVKDFDSLYNRFLPYFDEPNSKKSSDEKKRILQLKYKYQLRLQQEQNALQSKAVNHSPKKD